MKSKLLLLTLCSVLGGTFVDAQPGKPPSADAFFSNPEWRNRFLASYGVDSDTEPKIGEEEIELFQDLLELIKVNPRVAATRLQQEIDGESSPALVFVLANLYFQTGDTEKAIASYRDAISRSPDFRRAHSNLGLLLVQNGQLADAVGHLSRSIQLGDRDARTYGLLGYCHLSLENFLSAEQAYRSAVLQDPKNEDWETGLARTLLEMEKFSDAAKLFEKQLRANPSDGRTWMLLANSYIGMKESMKGATALEMARELDAASRSSLSLLGDIYLQNSIPELAKDAYLAAVDADESFTAFGGMLRAARLLYQVYAYDEAQEVVDKLQSAYAKVLSVDEELELLTLSAKLARARGDEAAAVETLESIVKRDGTRGSALIELADFYFNAASGMAPEAKDAQGRSGEELRQSAFFKLEQAQRLEAFERDALVKNAQFLVSLRDYQKAASLLRQALQLEGSDRLERYLSEVERAARSAS